MISFLKGIIIDKDDKKAILEISGIGYNIFLGQKTLTKIQLGDILEIFTHFYVRETEMRLYGFTGKKQLEFFEQLISAKGLGPQSALHLLDLYTPADIQNAILLNRPELITQAPGVGKKTAERLIVDLKNKIGKLNLGTASSAAQNSDQETVDALTALGYNSAEISKALSKMPADIKSSGEKIKIALKILKK